MFALFTIVTIVTIKLFFLFLHADTNDYAQVRMSRKFKISKIGNSEEISSKRKERKLWKNKVTGWQFLFIIIVKGIIIAIKIKTNMV